MSPPPWPPFRHLVAYALMTVARSTDIISGVSDSGLTVVRVGFSVPAGDQSLALRQLARVCADLAAALSIQDVIRAAVTHAAQALGAAVTTLMLTEDDELVLVAGHGVRPDVGAEWARFGLDDVNPASEAARRGTVVALGSVGQIERDYPVLTGQVPPGRSLLCLPLGNAQPAPGVLGLTFDDGWLPTRDELAFLTMFADTCGQAVRRIQLSTQASERAAQLAFLAQASAELTNSLDYRATLSRVAQLAVPTLADWCAVDILHDGAELVTLAVAHTDPAKVHWAWELQKRYPPDRTAATGSANVVRTGISELYAEITDEMLIASAHDEQHLTLMRELNMRSVLIVALLARGRALGAITLIRAESARNFSPTDLATAEDLARRAGAAIDNAVLFEQAQDVASQLQWAVMPERLTTIPGWDIATHFVPGGEEQVGGDFYDAVQLDEARLAFTIGDVMGHGVTAAAAMAQIRAATRAYLCTNPDPQSVLDSLDAMFQHLAIPGLVTMIYGIIDIRAATLTFCNAGHHPPVVISDVGTARLIDDGPRRLLGAGPDDRTPTRVPFHSSDTLLLYTDGLIESRDDGTELGTQRLLQAAPQLIASELHRRLTELVDHTAAHDTSDDVTAVAIRRTQSPT